VTELKELVVVVVVEEVILDLRVRSGSSLDSFLAHVNLLDFLFLDLLNFLDERRAVFNFPFSDH